MLTEICQEIRNWFDVERKFGEFTIADGHITVDGLQSGQYFRIIGSVFNDGVHKSTDTLHNEVFNGAVWLMAVPPDVVALDAEIAEWVTNYGAVVTGPYASESFGEYSYTMGSRSGANGTATAPTWQSTFAKALNRWRKI